MQECDGRPQPGTRPSRRCGPLAWAALGFAVLIGLVFADLLLFEDVLMPSHAQGDGARYFVFGRLFGYSELRQGNLPLWNPHTFSGAPFVGLFQSAMLYPPNLLHLLVPVAKGISVEIALHLFLMALFLFVWMRGKGVTPAAAFVATLSVVFGAASSLRVLAGQLSVIDTYAWWPLLLIAIDRLGERVTLGWGLAGIAATTLMILAGHPPTVLMGGVAAALYCIPVLLASRERLRLLGCLGLIALAPLGLSAAQLWTGLHTAAEGVRGGGMSYDFAVSHSFPPEQLLTLLAPEAFGNADEFFFSYFGRVFYWDATLYLGMAGLLLALHGAVRDRGPHRTRALVLASFLCLCAMGGYTPLYRLLYEALPGFGFIRAPSKFLFFASVFAGLLVGLGADRLLAERRGAARAAAVAAGLAVLLAAAAVWTALQPPASPGAFSPIDLFESLRGSRDFHVEGDSGDWQLLMLRSFSIASGLAAATAALLWLADRRRAGAWLLLAFAVLELFAFARVNRGTTRSTIELDLRPAVVAAYRAAGTTRVLETASPSNVAVAQRNYAIWGYDPVILHRYARFIAFTQVERIQTIHDPTLLQPTRFHPLLSMLRTRLHVVWKTQETIDHPDPLPRFLLLRDYRVITDEDAILTAMGAPDFDPRRSLILESEPMPPPLGGDALPVRGRVRVIDQSTDHVDLEVDLADAAILVVTDSYSNGWRAIALAGSEQADYRLLPANYVLRAVALSAGHHRLRLEYSPWPWRAGLWATGLSGLLYLAALAWWGFDSWRSRHSPATAAFTGA